VHGFLFALPATGKARLDQAEGRGAGYDEAMVDLETDGGVVRAVTYVAAASHIDDSLQPFVWYRDLVVAGAETLGLPPDYISAELFVHAIEDPNRGRAVENLRGMPCGKIDPSTLG